jgi:hypothetical protein
MKGAASLAAKRRLFVERFAPLNAMLMAAYATKARGA